MEERQKKLDAAHRKNIEQLLTEWPSITHYKPPKESATVTQESSVDQTSNDGNQPRVKRIFLGPWHVEEKIDGSQLSFRVLTPNAHENDNSEGTQKVFPSTGEMYFRCRNTVISEKEPFNSIFTNSMLSISSLKSKLNPDYIYRGEAVCKPRHNVIVYKRTPIHYFVLFDIEDCANKRYLSYEEKAAEATRLGLEVVPRLFASDKPEWVFSEGNLTCNRDEAEVAKILEDIESGKIESLLGGKPEGVVIKNYSLNLRQNGMPTVQKCVREEFKEEVGSKRPTDKPQSTDDLCRLLGAQYNVVARWNKAVQHLREDGLMSGQAKDLQHLTRELDKDLFKEHREDIANFLIAEFFPKIAQYAREGVVDWYKEQYVQKKPPQNENK